MHFHQAEGPVGLFSFALSARLCGFMKNRRPFILKAPTTAAKWHIKFIARRAIHDPLNLLNPLYPATQWLRNPANPFLILRAAENPEGSCV